MLAFSSQKILLKSGLQNIDHFVPTSMNKKMDMLHYEGFGPILMLNGITMCIIKKIIYMIYFLMYNSQ